MPVIMRHCCTSKASPSLSALGVSQCAALFLLHLFNPFSLFPPPPLPGSSGRGLLRMKDLGPDAHHAEVNATAGRLLWSPWAFPPPQQRRSDPAAAGLAPGEWAGGWNGNGVRAEAGRRGRNGGVHLTRKASFSHKCTPTHQWHSTDTSGLLPSARRKMSGSVLGWGQLLWSLTAAKVPPTLARFKLFGEDAD